MSVIRVGGVITSPNVDTVETSQGKYVIANRKKLTKTQERLLREGGKIFSPKTKRTYSLSKRIPKEARNIIFEETEKGARVVYSLPQKTGTRETLIKVGGVLTDPSPKVLETPRGEKYVLSEGKLTTPQIEALRKGAKFVSLKTQRVYQLQEPIPSEAQNIRIRETERGLEILYEIEGEKKRKVVSERKVRGGGFQPLTVDVFERQPFSWLTRASEYTGEKTSSLVSLLTGSKTAGKVAGGFVSSIISTPVEILKTPRYIGEGSQFLARKLSTGELVKRAREIPSPEDMKIVRGSSPSSISEGFRLATQGMKERPEAFGTLVAGITLGGYGLLRAVPETKITKAEIGKGASGLPEVVVTQKEKLGFIGKSMKQEAEILREQLVKEIKGKTRRAVRVEYIQEIGRERNVKKIITPKTERKIETQKAQPRFEVLPKVGGGIEASAGEIKYRGGFLIEVTPEGARGKFVSTSSLPGVRKRFGLRVDVEKKIESVERLNKKRVKLSGELRERRLAVKETRSERLIPRRSRLTVFEERRTPVTQIWAIKYDKAPLVKPSYQLHSLVPLVEREPFFDLNIFERSPHFWFFSEVQKRRPLPSFVFPNPLSTFLSPEALLTDEVVTPETARIRISKYDTLQKGRGSVKSIPGFLNLEITSSLGLTKSRVREKAKERALTISRAATKTKTEEPKKPPKSIFFFPDFGGRSKGERREKLKFSGFSLKHNITPLADWYAVTMTEAMFKYAPRVRRPEKKREYKKLMERLGFGLTFPTRELEGLKKSPKKNRRGKNLNFL
jgi:hypothetical protein